MFMSEISKTFAPQNKYMIRIDYKTKNSQRDVRGHHTPGEIILIVLIWLELYNNLCFT